MKDSHSESLPDPALRKRLEELELPRGQSDQDWESLKRTLGNRIAHMLENQTERLMQILYRLDVRESKVRSVFQEQPQDKWPEALAGLIVEREQERLRWRNFYDSMNKED